MNGTRLQDTRGESNSPDFCKNGPAEVRPRVVLSTDHR
jgi:hypothetical protein